MQWYAVQTYTGKEEKLAEMIRRMDPDLAERIGDCFVPYFEQMHCWRQQNQIRVLRLFPGYLFLSTDDIAGLFQRLKRIPAMSKVLTTGAFEFAAMDEEEVDFFLQMMDSDHIVRLTYVATDGKNHVSYLSGPLEKCEGHILEYRFRKRYARIRLRIAGREKEARAGIILNDDVRREMAYGKVEAPIPTPEKYEIPAAKQVGDMGGVGCGGSVASQNTEFVRNCDPSKGEDAGNGTKMPCRTAQGFAPGDRVAVIDGAFRGNVAVIRKAKSSDVWIAVHMFGRDISAEIPAESVRKLG